MSDLFEQRFEQSLDTLRSRLQRKHTVKRQDTSGHWAYTARNTHLFQRYYKIGVQTDTSGTVTSIDYRKDTQLHAQEQSEQGVYFLRTNMDVEEERIVWEIYNIIRDRKHIQMSEDRPATFGRYIISEMMPQWHTYILGILAYTVVNTVRQRLKVSGINHSWTEIFRIARTQRWLEQRGTNKQPVRNIRLSKNL
ncbi:MAG: hypothetical protein IPI42_10720 [Saprospiraceae bacterium]|nr:hypothetical protein [Candidatus Parvibacillus calidus]